MLKFSQYRGNEQKFQQIDNTEAKKTVLNITKNILDPYDSNDPEKKHLTGKGRSHSLKNCEL